MLLKTTLFFFLIIFCGMVCFFPQNGFAQEPTPIVRLIYFLPNDRTPDPKIDEKMVLDIYGNNITDISPIAALVNLEFLFFQEDPITDKAPLNALLEMNPNVQINIDTNKSTTPS